MYRQWFIILAFLAAVATARGELPEGATVLDQDIVWDIGDPDCATISPDGKLVAYISKGGVWICSVVAGPPARLADVPDTPTALMAMPQYREARTNFKRLRAILGNVVYNESIQPNLVAVFGLQWTRSQDGVIYGLSKRSPKDRRSTIHTLMHVSLKGVVTTLATIKKDVYGSPQSLIGFHVAQDREHAVVWHHTPLIWDLVKNRPRATCFDYLLPSSTSDRFLGIEIDTRQLVVTDEKLQISKRFDVTFDLGRGCDLFWSPDERYVIGRSYGHAEFPKSAWTGFRLDLETGNKRLMTGEFVTDRFVFTGLAGEVVRSGIIGREVDYLNALRGAYLTIVPDGDGPARALARFRVVPQPALLAELRERPPYPRVLHNPDFTLFAMALPHSSGKHSGYDYHLLHRDGRQWKFPIGTDPPYIAPYHLVAFADDGRTLVARNDSQLFSIPVEVIQANKETSDE
ncbi:MAG: hypothetical protein WD851_11050 [Pirellulales bacterium]